jgi:hypothetical protein
MVVLKFSFFVSTFGGRKMTGPVPSEKICLRGNLMLIAARNNSAAFHKE